MNMKGMLKACDKFGCRVISIIDNNMARVANKQGTEIVLRISPSGMVTTNRFGTTNGCGFPFMSKSQYAKFCEEIYKNR